MKAIHSPHTGIVDWALVTEYYGKDFVKGGGKIFLNSKVIGFRAAAVQDSKSVDYPVVVQCKDKVRFGKFYTKFEIIFGKY